MGGLSIQDYAAIFVIVGAVGGFCSWLMALMIARELHKLEGKIIEHCDEAYACKETTDFRFEEVRSRLDRAGA